LHGGSRIAALAQHLVEARRAQPRILRQRVAQERQIRVERRRPTAAAATQHTGAIDGSEDGLMMDAELGRDGADFPVLGVVQPTNLGA
jgi:hypothetical protein